MIGDFHRALVAALSELPDVRREILYIDDGSTDSTLELLNDIARDDRSVAVVSLSRNFGHQIALTAGLDFARGDAVVMMDSDLQHPPSLIPEMVRQWRAGFDVVSAVRTNVQRSWFKTSTSRAFYALINYLSPTPVPRDAADFCLLSKPAHRSLQTMRERHRFLRGMVSWMGFNRTFIPYTVHARAAGTSKYTVGKMLAMAADAIFSFSSAPLRLATRVGLAITFSGFVYLTWILVRFFVAEDFVPGWASLIGVSLVLGGSQLLFMGLIGEYLARVFEEVKGRPLYVVKQAPRAPRPNTRSGAQPAGGDDMVRGGPTQP